MPRWTIRGVNPEAIRAIQQVQAETGVCLGEIVSACIKLGLPEARRRLEQMYRRYNEPSPEVIALQEALRKMTSCSQP
jgi:hypothetical protein